MRRGDAISESRWQMSGSTAANNMRNVSPGPDFNHDQTRVVSGPGQHLRVVAGLAVQRPGNFFHVEAAGSGIGSLLCRETTACLAAILYKMGS